MQWKQLGPAIGMVMVGCGGGGGAADAHGDQDQGTDLAPGPDVGPDVGPDLPIPCYACESPGAALVCRPNQAAAGGCVFGDGRPGDLCTPAFPCAAGDCVSFGTDAVGFCATPCAADPDCTVAGTFCRLDSDRPPDGVPDHCLWTCTTTADCPQ